MKLPRGHHLPIETLAGQLFMVPIQLLDGKDFYATLEEARQWVHIHKISGFLIERGSAPAIRFFTDHLSRLAPFPLFFAVDVTTLHKGLLDCTAFPSPLQIGAGANRETFQAYAHALGQEFRAMGINLAFVPLLNRAILDPNGILCNMAYHHASDVLRDFRNSFVQIFQHYGIAPVLQYFPPMMHLSVHPMEHLVHQENASLPQIWQNCFPRAGNQTPPGISIAPVISFDSQFPVFMNVEVMQQWTKQSRYFGVIFSPRLDLPALRQYFYSWEMERLAIQAGVHCLVAPRRPLVALQQLKTVLQTNDDLARQAHLAVDRQFRLKKWLHAHQPKQAHPYRVFKKVHHPQHHQIAQRLAQNGIMLLKESDHFPTLWKTVERAIVIDVNANRQMDDFWQTLLKIFPSVHWFNQELPREWHPHTGDLFIILLKGIETKQTLSKQLERLTPFFQYVKANSLPVVSVMWEVQRAEQIRMLKQLPGSVILTLDGTPPIQQAVARFLSGRLASAAKFPFAIENNKIYPIQYNGYAAGSMIFSNRPSSLSLPEQLQFGVVIFANQQIATKGDPGKPLALEFQHPLVYRFHLTAPLILQAMDANLLHPGDPLVDFIPSLKSTHGETLVLDDALSYHIAWEGKGMVMDINQAIQQRLYRLRYRSNPIPHPLTELLLWHILQMAMPHLDVQLNTFYQTLAPFLFKSDVTVNATTGTVHLTYWHTLAMAYLLIHKGWYGTQQIWSSKVVQKANSPLIMGLLLGKEIIASDYRVPALEKDFFLPHPHWLLWISPQREMAGIWGTQANVNVEFSSLIPYIFSLVSE